MSDKYHIGKNGPAICPAKIQCRLKEADGSPARHYSSFEEAQEAFETQMAPSLISTIAQKIPAFKKLAKVGTSISVALVSLVGVSNVANATEVPAGWLDSIDTDSISNAVSDVTDGLNGLANKANDWLGRDEVKDSAINKKVDEYVSKAPGFETFRSILEDGLSFSGPPPAPLATVQDDGSILWQGESLTPTQEEVDDARAALESLPIMPEASGDDYDRSAMFGDNKEETRAATEQRDITDGEFNDYGRVVSGTLKDPYTGEKIEFSDSERPHDLEHLVALKEVYRSEDPNNPLTDSEREAIANDPDNLLLVESGENRRKSDKDAKDYIPSYEPAQHRFAISTIKVKEKYGLTVDKGEYEALSKILDTKIE